MPDSKITALTALTAADPAVDMFPVVDVSDTTMAASGTTKRISINNILACSPAATLASLNVTGSSIPANGLYLPTTNTLEFAANNLAQYRIAPLGVFSWYDGAGGTRMTLNATGLAIGDTAFAGTRLTLRESASQPNALAMTNRNATQTWRIGVDVSAVDDKILGFYDSTSTTFRMQLYDAGHLVSTVPTTPPTLSINSTAVWNLTSNTNLRVSVRGTDGVTRVANITLA